MFTGFVSGQLQNGKACCFRSLQKQVDGQLLIRLWKEIMKISSIYLGDRGQTVGSSNKAVITDHAAKPVASGLRAKPA